MFWILLLISAASYFILLLGVSSMNKYSLLGALRSISQILTLEITLIIIFFKFFSLFSTSTFISEKSFSFFLFISGGLFLVVALLETHRSPFDLSEGESELVSGFNTEFSSILFMMIFLSEYSNVLLFAFLTSTIFYLPQLEFFLLSASAMLLVRSCFPRVRYDLMMAYAWTKLTPLATGLFLLGLTWKIT